VRQGWHKIYLSFWPSHLISHLQTCAGRLRRLGFGWKPGTSEYNVAPFSSQRISSTFSPTHPNKNYQRKFKRLYFWVAEFQSKSLTVRKSHSKDISKQRRLTAKKSHSKGVTQQRIHVAKKSHSKEVTQHRSHTAKKSQNKDASQQRTLTAQKSHSKEVSKLRRFYSCTHGQGWQHKSRPKRANIWHENHIIDILRARPFVVQNRERCPHFVQMVAELKTSPYLSLWPVAIEDCWIGTAIYKLQRLIFGNYILGTQV